MCFGIGANDRGALIEVSIFSDASCQIGLRVLAELTKGRGKDDPTTH
jgi:hypothetical protein